MSWLGYAVLAHLVAVAGQSALLRCRLVGNGMAAFLVCALPAGLVLVVVLLLFYRAAPAWAGILLYAFACELWMFAFSSTFSSISANLMLHLRGGAMRRGDIDLLYDDRGMVQRRIGWLREIGAAQSAGSRLIPTPFGRRLAGWFNALRGFFGHSEEANRAQESRPLA